MPEDYKQNERFELSQKVLRIGDDVDQFFDDMQTLFREIDPFMPEDYKVAEVRRAINGISERKKFLAVAEADTVQKIRVVLKRMATVDKAQSITQQATIAEKTDVRYYQENQRRS